MVITGVIRPPPEIRAVADRTASYVAKNGRAFEARILKSEKGKTPKFAFLQPTSPFHAYYEERIQFYANGGDDKKDETKEEKKEPDDGSSSKNTNGTSTTATPKEMIRKKEKTQKASAIDPIAKALLAQRAKITQAKEKAEKPQGEEEQAPPLPPPPPPLELVKIVAPLNMTAAQLEAIQLAAQFAALDGKGGHFLHQLTLKEWNNPEFSFLQPRHANFAYFSSLVDAYRRIFGIWTSAADTAEKNSDKPHVFSSGIQVELDEAAYRAEYQRELEQRKSQKEEGEVVAIDWHDFVVVETIDFPVNEIVELSMLPPPPPPPPTEDEPTSNTKSGGDVMDESDDEEEENIRVVPSYTPKVVGPSNPQSARAIDPITGKSVSVADMPEHMRIQLLDPKWAEERKKFQEKQKDSNLVSGDAVASNISRFAQARGDLFGKSEQDLLSQDKDKRRLEDVVRDQANRHAQLAHQQQQQQQYATGVPVKPPAGPPRSMEPPIEPAAKRMRHDGGSFPPPPPPPPPQRVATMPPPPPPLETNPIGDSIQQQTAGDSMADAMLGANTTSDEMSEKKLIPEAEFAASLSKPEVTLQIRIPNDPTQMAWNFYGQILSMTVNVMSKVKNVKADLSRTHLNGMPSNKIQFRDPQSGFLKDNMTLAALNIGPTATLEMKVKSRGGRK